MSLRFMKPAAVALLAAAALLAALIAAAAFARREWRLTAAIPARIYTGTMRARLAENPATTTLTLTSSKWMEAGTVNWN